MEKEQIEVIPTNSDKENQNSYGKFKNADELLKAYNALEGEFTKRSQKLKELEKNIVATTELQIEENWETRVKKFMNEYPVAGSLAKDLAHTVATDEKYVNEKNGLEKALVDLLSSKIKPKEAVIKDEEIVTMVLNDENNRKKVIDDYLNTLNAANLPKTLPKTGGVIPCGDCKPQSFADASKLAQKYLEQK